MEPLMPPDRYAEIERLLDKLEGLIERNALGPSATATLDLSEYAQYQQEFNALVLPLLQRALRLQVIQVAKPCKVNPQQVHIHHGNDDLLVDAKTHQLYLGIEDACTEHIHEVNLMRDDVPVEVTFTHIDDSVAQVPVIVDDLDHLSTDLRAQLFNLKIATESQDDDEDVPVPQSLVRTCAAIMNAIVRAGVPVYFYWIQRPSDDSDPLYATFAVNDAKEDDESIGASGDLVGLSNPPPRLPD